MNVTKLREVMFSKNINVENLCKMTGIDRSRMYRRLNSDGRKMTLEEAKQIAQALQLTNDMAIHIFLSA